jgi:butyryl-CoA dehydrogenase
MRPTAFVGIVDFALTETQELTRKTVREFAEQEIVPESLAFDESQEFPARWAKRMGELGLLGVFVPEKYGGSGLDNVSYAITIEELSRADASAGVIAAVCNGLVCEPLLRYGTEEQKRRYLEPVARGEWIGAYALTEPGSGSDAAAMRTTARLEKDEWVLDGTKAFITNAYAAKVLVVYARTGEKKHEISAFVVPTDAKGFTLQKKENKMGIRASDTMLVGFDSMRIPKENLLGELHKGFSIAMATLDGGRIGIAAQALGIGQRALEESVKFAKEREAFGQKISEFQAIQWKIADMATEIDGARLLTYRAAALKDQGVKHTYESSVAKLFASEASHRAVDHAVQIHGGYGFIKDYVVEKLYRDQRVTEIYEGTSEVQRLVIARAVLGT